MSDISAPNGKPDEFLDELEKSIVKIIKGTKNSKADKISAINAGVRLAAIRHKIAGAGESDEGFFSK